MEAYEIITLLIMLCVWTYFGFMAIMERVVGSLVGLGRPTDAKDDALEYVYYIMCGPFGWLIMIASFVYWIRGKR